MWGKLCGEIEVAQLCPTLCNPVDCSLPGSSIHGTLQARILVRVAISFSRGSSQTRVSRIAGRRFTLWAPMEVQICGEVAHKCFLPGGASCKEPTCQCRDRHGLYPWVRKIPWRRKWQPTPVLLPGESHGWRSLVGYSPWGLQRVGRDWATSLTEKFIWGSLQTIYLSCNVGQITVLYTHLKEFPSVKLSYQFNI